MRRQEELKQKCQPPLVIEDHFDFAIFNPLIDEIPDLIRELQNTKYRSYEDPTVHSKAAKLE